MLDHVQEKPNELFEIMWRINERCNYRCEYCFREGIDEDRTARTEKPGDFTPEQMTASFDRTGKTWKIHITGGEPFLAPGFIELAARLSEKHRLSINTNLATANVRDFWESVNPAGVHCLNASLHLAEREKRGGKEKFLADILELQKRGFRVKLLFIAYPPQMDRVLNERDYFMTRGVKLFNLKVFRGMYNGKSFPGSYDSKQRRLMEEIMTSEYEKKILQGKTSFIGRFCKAGQRAFNMDAQGNLTRCATLQKSYGNLFLGTQHFDEQADICDARLCACPYQGMKFARTGNGIGFWKDKARAYGRAISRRIIRNLSQI